MLNHLTSAFVQVLQFDILLTMLLSGIFGLFVGAIPGLTATMAVALLVPVTFFLPPLAAIATMVTATAMAIFSGDIPGCLLRIPGTPASAAYTDESYKMAQSGRASIALGSGLVFSCIGGLLGTIVLIFAAPKLADLALEFSSYEYFWLVLLGLTCAIFIASNDVLKGFVSLAIGLMIASVGMDNPAGFPRLTFGNEQLLGGLSLVPVMVGMFAVSEVLRFAVNAAKKIEPPDFAINQVFKGMGTLIRTYPAQLLRGSALGTVVGALPGAGADIASYMSYAMSKKLSKEPEKFGTGHVEGIIEAGAANNSSLAGAWIPALVFGIPGDSITAIVIGVLYMKDLNPGPMIFINNPVAVYSIFVIFILANLLMLPLGYVVIKLSRHILRTPRNILMPLILLFCIVGAYAINNNDFDVGVMLVFGLLAYLMEDNGFPIAPTILGVVLGGMFEDNFISSVIKSDGNILAFINRPISGILAAVTLLVWLSPLMIRYLKNYKRVDAKPHN